MTYFHPGIQVVREEIHQSSLIWEKILVGGVI